MANYLSAIRRFFTDTWGSVRVADSQPFSVARFDQLPTCTEKIEGVEGWVRGGTGVASFGYQCLKSDADAYAWSVIGSGNVTTDLATHAADTTTHGATGAIVGTTNVQDLTNKTLITPTIGDFTNATHDHADAAGGGSIAHTDLTSIGTNSHSQIDSHISSTSNPHSVTKTQVGLGNVDNTADTSKPVSTDQQAALNLKANLANPTFTGTVSGISKSMVGLGNVDNTADASKPVSTDQQTALNLKANLANPTFTGTVSGISKSMVGLGNVDNTSDANKPVSTDQQTALNLKANTTHAHAAADVTSGVLATARLGSGTADSLVFLRGDQTWSELPLVPWVWNATYTGEFGTNGTGNGQFADGIRGIAVRDDTGDVYVSSGTGATSKVSKHSANGTWDRDVATYGTGDGEVDTPWGLVWVPLWARLVIVDNGNNRVHWRNINDAFVGQRTSINSQALNGPRGVAVTGGATISLVYVMDTGNDRRAAFYFGLSESSDFQSSWPGVVGGFIDVAEGSNWSLYLTFVGVTPLVVKIKRNPNTLIPIGSFGSGKGQFDTPHSISTDRQGNIYVTDSGNHRVQVFDSVGIFQGSFGSYGTGDGEFDTPTGIAITDDYIYVCDSGNSRVQIFANPVTAPTKNLFVFTEQATASVSNSSTTTYATVATISEVLPAGDWNVVAMYTQTYTAAGAGFWQAIARFNGTAGASSTFSAAESVTARASVTGSITEEVSSDGSTATEVRAEFVRSGTFANTPQTEGGFLTAIFTRVS